MKYEYNGHMTFEERVISVARDIMKKYPSIKKEDAISVARVESPIIDVKNEKLEFNRLYEILYIIDKKSELYKTVLDDLKEVYSRLLKNNQCDHSLEDRLMNQILNYENKKRVDFPSIPEVF